MLTTKIDQHLRNQDIAMHKRQKLQQSLRRQGDTKSVFYEQCKRKPRSRVNIPDQRFLYLLMALDCAAEDYTFTTGCNQGI
jgi:hypothetical protein